MPAAGYWILNQVSTNLVATKKEIEDCDDFLSGFDNLTRFDSFLGQRIAIARAFRKGMTIVESADLKAIKSIYKEVFSVH